MTRRVTPSQLRGMIRQAEQKQVAEDLPKGARDGPQGGRPVAAGGMGDLASYHLPPIPD